MAHSSSINGKIPLKASHATTRSVPTDLSAVTAQTTAGGMRRESHVFTQLPPTAASSASASYELQQRGERGWRVDILHVTWTQSFSVQAANTAISERTISSLAQSGLQPSLNNARSHDDTRSHGVKLLCSARTAIRYQYLCIARSHNRFTPHAHTHTLTRS